MSVLDELGITTTNNSLSGAIDSFNNQNMSPSDILAAGNSIPRTLGGIPAIGSRIPGMSSVPIPGISAIDKVFAPINQMKFGQSGVWESVKYSHDLNSHHPKFKFLFKVMFSGFNGNDFYHYVLRADKPKVRFNHQDVNYYNFRSRVLTSVTYEPLSITFFDEIGNTLNDFFVGYLKSRSGTGSGNYGIDRGFGEASSSKYYQNGYTEKLGQRIILEQVFANGTQSNRYIFINPRIENFDFDELSMEESNTGSHATLTFTYDAIEMMTVYGSTIHSWGNVDLLRGGGSSGPWNGGNTSGVFPGIPGSATGILIDGTIPKTGGSELYSMFQRGSDMLSQVPNALGGIVAGTAAGIGSAISESGIGASIRSVTDTVSQGISDTLQSITSGANLNSFSNNDGNWSYDDATQNDGNWSYDDVPQNDGNWSYE
jgi:hypothetical protein